MLVGVGGGVVADLTGYVAATFLRGVEFGFVPTSILAMVDASIGGKNGINVGLFKNIVGTIRQPSFILFDVKLTSSLPEKEWRNGFAEIIKHACIKDAKMFRELEANGPDKYKPGSRQLALLVERNAILKTRIVQRDELETGERRILNFGHTLGHALENLYELPHGHAGCRMIVCPFLNRDAAHARCIALLDAGANTAPVTCPGLMITCISYFF